MDKYDGTNKPNVTLSLNDVMVRSKLSCAPTFDCDTATTESAALLREDELYSEVGAVEKKKGGSRIASFFIRGAVAALLLGFLFLPRLLPYSGSEKVTEAAKTIIMSDITQNKTVGEGKIVEIIRKIIQKSSSEESDDEKEE